GLGHHRPDDQQQRRDEYHRQQQAADHQMDRIVVAQVVARLVAAAQTDEGPRHGDHRLEKIHLASRRTGRHAPPLPCGADCGAAAWLLTSKNVYDNVIVWTSFGSFGSITNTTGNSRASRGFRSCWLKQKHSSFLK